MIEELKNLVSVYVAKFIKDDMIVGVGSGSTITYFINELKNYKLDGAVASSNHTAALLTQNNIKLYNLNSVDIDIYIDSADEFDIHKRLLKGMGGALTREKIIAKSAKNFICIADETKYVSRLGQKTPISVEVIPIARKYVAIELSKLGGKVVLRDGYTDNQNIIIECYMDILDPLQLEKDINTISGVVENGIFATCIPSIIYFSCKDMSIKIIK